MFKFVNKFVDGLKKSVNTKQKLQISSCEVRGLICDTRNRADRVFDQAERQRDRLRFRL